MLLRMTINIGEMLQIDESQLEVYSCSFNICVGTASLPLKFKAARYFVEWKLKNKQSGSKSAERTINELGYIEFNDQLKIHTDILRNCRSRQFLKKYGQLTLFLISSKQPVKPKIVGSMLIGLHEVLNCKQYAQMKYVRLKLSPFDVDLQFKCEVPECRTSSILQANLDAALVVQENFMTRSTFSSGLKAHGQANSFLKKKITQELYDQDDKLSKGECSILRPQLEEVLESNESPIQCHSSLLLNSNSLIDEPEQQRVPQYSEDIQKQGKKAQSHNFGRLLKENRNLRRLIMMSGNERKIEAQRYEQQLREMARQLSLKEAELLKITETHQSGSMKVGELLDSECLSIQKFKFLQKQNQTLSQQIAIQKQYSTQLEENYKRLQNRLEMVKEWEQERVKLLERINQLEDQNEHLQLKYFDLQNKSSISEEKNSKIIKQRNLRIKEMEEQSDRLHKIIALYEEKVNKFEEEISFMQEEVISRVEYSASTEHTIEQTAWQTKQNHRSKSQNSGRSGDKEHIVIEGDSLKDIQQEELEESFISGTGDKQIATAAQLPSSHTAESDFYRKMARNVQNQLDQLRLLYRQKDSILLRERATSKSLYEQLERLRFEFVYELSRVTSLLNNKILQIRQLKEENNLLKQKDAHLYASKLVQLENELNILEQQRLQYFDKCCRLSEENINIINLNKEKEEIYLSIIKNHRQTIHPEKDLIASQFQRIVTLMLNNQGKYFTTLKKYGIIEPLVSDNSFHGQQPSSQSRSPTIISNIIHRFGAQHNLSDSGRSSFTPSQDDLLIQSTARHHLAKSSQVKDPSLLFQRMLGELSELKSERQKGVSFIRELATKSSVSCKRGGKVAPLFQALKKTIMCSCGQNVRISLLQAVRSIETKLEVGCYQD